VDLHFVIGELKAHFATLRTDNSTRFLTARTMYLSSVLMKQYFIPLLFHSKGRGKNIWKAFFLFSPLFFHSFSLGSADSTMTSIASRCENTNSRSHSL